MPCFIGLRQEKSASAVRVERKSAEAQGRVIVVGDEQAISSAEHTRAGLINSFLLA